MNVARATALAFLFCNSGAALAQDFDADLDQGHGLFFTFCATCHGDDATGGGPMTDGLKITPPDLTGLKARNDGIFPTARVAFRIDGRDPIPAHGGPMPLFGQLFEGDSVMVESETGQPLLLARDIADVIAWLESVQE